MKIRTSQVRTRALHRASWRLALADPVPTKESPVWHGSSPNVATESNEKPGQSARASQAVSALTRYNTKSRGHDAGNAPALTSQNSHSRKVTVPVPHTPRGRETLTSGFTPGMWRYE